jgi:hypothetical protein
MEAATRTAGQNGDEPGEVSMIRHGIIQLQAAAPGLRQRTHAYLVNQADLGPKACRPKVGTGFGTTTCEKTIT